MKKVSKGMFAMVMAGALVMVSGSVYAGPKEDKKAEKKGDNIVEVAVAVNSEGAAYEGMFDTLIAAVLAADPAVLATLTGNGQHTVFAPTDDAFAALELTPENIGDLDKAFLTDVLLYHVASGKLNAKAVVGSKQVRTLSKQFIQQEGGVLTDTQGRKANIIVTDVKASNGIIHVIDAVVLPYAPPAADSE